MNLARATLACVVIAVTLTACGGTTPPTASEVVQQLKAAGLPVTDGRATPDPKHPNLSQAAWADSRVPRSRVSDTSQGSVDLGGNAIVFASPALAHRRVANLVKIKRIAAVIGVREYDYVRGSILLRISSLLTPVQAAQYGHVIGGTLVKP